MAEVDVTPKRLAGTNLLFGFSGAGLIVMLTWVHGVRMLGESILWSIMLLQFYRAVLLLFSFGAAEAWAGMRKWKVKHWTTQAGPAHDGG